MSTVLEVLRAADARLADPDEEYVFGNWRQCTCGHIYAAAGGTSPNQFHVLAGNEAPAVYYDALKAVVDANPAATSEGMEFTAVAVSNATRELGGGYDSDADHPRLRAAARALVLNAIWMLEERYERQRLDVLAQTREIVDDAAGRVEPARVLAT